MSDNAVSVTGRYDAGIIISAMRPQHLDPTNRLGPQSLVLTGAQAKRLYEQLHSLRCQADGGWQ